MVACFPLARSAGRFVFAGLAIGFVALVDWRPAETPDKDTRS
jgi:hypothetical protein